MTTEPRAAVRVTRRFDASPERVFDAWLDPATVGRWLFATPTGRVVRAEIDARVGGSYTIVDRRDGEDVAHAGRDLEIDRPRRLVFTLSVEKYEQDVDRVAVDVAPLDAGCELTLTHEMRAVSAEIAGRAEGGWAGVLRELAATLGEGSAPAASTHHDGRAAKHTAGPQVGDIAEPFTLADQFEVEVAVTYATGVPTVIVFADRSCAIGVRPWVERLVRDFGDRVHVVGVAAVGAVPTLVRGAVRAFLHGQPSVLLDWDNRVSHRFGYDGGECLIVVIDATGRVSERVGGACTDAHYTRVAAAAIA